MTFQTNFKPSRTARKKAEKQRKTDRATQEKKAMQAARRRDKTCRFPLCGCRKLGLGLEVAHAQHRGMGGNPSGDRTQTPILVLLCTHRHQFGGVSLHRGTLRALPLTDDGFDGAVAWEVDDSEPFEESRWTEVGRETKPGVLEPLTGYQSAILGTLAMMEDY